jgi:hypothetical protein
VTVCVQVPKESTKALLKLVRKDSKVAEYNINIQKPIAFYKTAMT